jgi:hypothetical protein
LLKLGGERVQELIAGTNRDPRGVQHSIRVHRIILTPFYREKFIRD